MQRNINCKKWLLSAKNHSQKALIIKPFFWGKIVGWIKKIQIIADRLQIKDE